MPTLIHRLAIHELEKAADESGARVFLSSQCTPIDEEAQALVDKLHDTFVRKSDTLQGYLSPPEDALFPGYFQLLLENGLEQADAFLNFTRDTMNALQLSLQGVLGAKGGYLVYADYTDEATQERAIGIFLVRDTDGLSFRRGQEGAAFELNSVTYLNTDKLAMACRIFVQKFQQGQGRCVELIKHARTQKEISEYFIQWVGLERPESSRELTQTFLDMVNELPAPVDEETGEAMEAGRFKEQVLNFANSNPQKVINIQEFEQEFYKNENPAQQYFQDHQIEMDNEFRFDKKALNQFYNHKASAEKLYLYFNDGHLRQGQIVVEGDSVTIHSPELAAQVRDFMDDRS
ncbi:nucleoid-associated protein [Phaeodactylibacter luteus]|uniref:Nucleoid-associated protein n=1 Tax=Phaeodactylibacter luteus TaxID=1564516 RepID=A0A5C6RXD0_9BACT|nr:nucleoid-associated protein [Phaeodactylibacter luteus]TXB66250.1 nucleoid-associated protein [Phaeodactylibacter luteus]